MNRLIVLLAAILAGCGDSPQPVAVLDQCMRREAFKECMAALPAGPQATKYNDWDEVVDQCDAVSTRQSYRLVAQVKPECRAQ